MPFTQGQKRPAGAGRKKGSGDRSTVADICARLKCDPISGMCKIAMDKGNDVALRGRMFAEIAKYVHPQKRAVETRLVDDAGNDRDITLNVIYSDTSLPE